jgi:hypothetical protein
MKLKIVMTKYLHSNVKARNVKRLEHDFCCVLPVLRCVERRLCLYMKS